MRARQSASAASVSRSFIVVSAIPAHNTFQRLQRTTLEFLHRVFPFPDDARGVSDAQVLDKAQEDDLPLIKRQLAERLLQSLAIQPERQLVFVGIAGLLTWRRFL